MSSISRIKKSPSEPTKTGIGGIELTEDGVALAFERRHENDLRYCHDAGRWYAWTCTRWEQDRTNCVAFTFARTLTRKLNRTSEFKTKAIDVHP